ncbi:MAG: hypothetical protein ACJAX6_000988 [Limisphaerales bacterium]|jgi:hypothetical protein
MGSKPFHPLHARIAFGGPWPLGSGRLEDGYAND